MPRSSAIGAILALVLLAGVFVTHTRLSDSANAQTPAAAGAPVPPPGATDLHLDAVGSVSVTPDELVADLSAEATSPAPAIAQNRVNTLMKQGMDAAAGVGVEARAQDYEVQQADQGQPVGGGGRPPLHPTWVARQTLELRLSSAQPLLDLVGKLQGQGFTVSALEWRVSAALERKTRDAAMVEALKALQGRARAAADTLGLHVDHLREVRIDTPEVMPVRPMMALQQRAMVAPQETRSSEDITSTASADILLRP